MEQSNDFISLQVNRGRRLTRILMIVNILLIIVLDIVSIAASIFSVITFLDTIISFFICIFIYGGSKVAKWIYIVFSGIAILRSFSLFGSMIESNNINEITLGDWILLIVPFLINIITSSILIFSESINEFLYKQAN